MSHHSIEDKYPMVRLVTYLIDMFDPYGINHSAGVASLSLQIAQCAGVKAQKELEELELAALLHDIGKMALPESIRSKPGKLTDAEYWLVKQHSRFGFDLLNHMNGTITNRVKLAVLYHHENMDGTGYPEGLKGQQIPREARIIRIADTYDAITHSRGYRLPITSDEAIQIMIAEEHVYDPAFFSCFLGIVRSNPPMSRYK